MLYLSDAVREFPLPSLLLTFLRVCLPIDAVLQFKEMNQGDQTQPQRLNDRVTHLSERLVSAVLHKLHEGGVCRCMSRPAMTTVRLGAESTRHTSLPPFHTRRPDPAEVLELLLILRAEL